jgi:hypothetical protein
MRSNEPERDPFAEEPDEPPVVRRGPMTWRRPADGRPVYGIDPGAPLPPNSPPDFGPVIARLAAEKFGVPVEAIRLPPPAAASAPYLPIQTAPPAMPMAPAAPPPAPPPVPQVPWPPPPPGLPADPWFAWPRHQGPALTPEQEWAVRGQAITQFLQSFGSLPPAPPPPAAWQPLPPPAAWQPLPPAPAPSWGAPPPPGQAPAEAPADGSEYWLLAAFVAALPLPLVGLGCAAVAFFKARAAGRPTAPALVAAGLSCVSLAVIAIVAALALS